MYPIIRREQFSDVTFLWDLLAPDVAKAAEPGHFVMIRLYEGGERIPLTVADFDRDRGVVTVVVQALGKTTREMRDAYDAGDTIADFVGPLGLPQHIAKVGHVLLIGGGLGVAPVFPQLRAFRAAGNRVTAIVGFRNKNLVFWEDKFREFADSVHVCTDDGSYGEQGNVTVALERILKEDPPDLVVAIGPLPMMHACVEKSRPYGVRTLVSLNTIMIDGTGMCGSCRVTVDGKVKFACVDGPDFDGRAVDFQELHARQKRFKHQEQRANEEFDHVCNLERQLVHEGKRNYKQLAKVSPHQTPMPERDPHIRAQNFEEVNLGYTLEEALAEAERCIQCVKPTCVSGCPVSIDIPTFIRHLLLRDIDKARETINEASIFPSVCGRVCPQETQCEAQCIVGNFRKHEPVAIGRIERFIGDHARARSMKPPPNAGALGAVAIVGSGPAGLAAAADLARAGAKVTVYEALHVLGGVLQYGIPSFRLPRPIIDREIQMLKDLGVRFETNKVIGKTFSIGQLRDQMGFDAVFIGAGAGAPSFLGIPGEFAGQVYSANEFLTRVNLMGGSRFPYQDTPVSVGRNVVVIGAGNTAMDCLRVARRLGSATVRCVYRRSEEEAPARIEEIRHAREEGIEFLFLHSPTEILLDESDNVRAMRVQRMALGEPDERGRRKPVPLDQFFDLECDTVIYALGTQPNPIIGQATKGLALNKYGNIAADPETQATNLRGVFAGGDIVTGGATVILAMGAGRRAAKAVEQWLRSDKKVWPVGTTRDPEYAEGGSPSDAPAHDHATCPKCHQPLEGDEPYICCARQELEWRCEWCDKVSEGFAFPYGLCPNCGGVLQPLHRESTEHHATFEAIRIAFEIELGGLAFYQRALARTDQPVLKELFGRFAEMERQHLHTLAHRYHVAVPETSSSASLDLAALKLGFQGNVDSPEALFQAAIEFEKRAVVHFERLAAESSDEPVLNLLFRELRAEEEGHVNLLQTAFQQWMAGESVLF